MFLLAAATDFELEPARQILAGRNDVVFLQTGVGPVEAAYTLTRYLSGRASFSGVINFGVAGAYLQSGIGLLETCLAGREILADFGVCLDNDIIPLSEDITADCVFDLNNNLFRRAEAVLAEAGLSFHSGTFLTVNCASGTTGRGNMLGGKFQAICENMEGAALARVCRGFGLESLEVRTVSNMVEDRDLSRWRLQEACMLAAEQAAFLFSRLSD